MPKPVPTVPSTIARTRDGNAAAAPRPEAFLFAVLAAKDASFEPARHALAGLEEITIGRGPARATRREGARLALEVADPWMSSRHARITLENGRFVARDCGSRNHTFVDGERIEERALEDGDVLEIGNVFFLFRAGVLADADDAGDRLASQLAPPAPLLATLCPPLARAMRRLASAAPSELSVFLGGESGTGKEVVARSVHALSGRRGAFVPVNCAAIAPTLVESELFGYRKGAFSGATEDRPGLVRSAEGGTLFLDEIGDLPLPAQGALLRVLQEREVVPVGGTRAIPVDLRVIAATHRDLDELVAQKAFRADLQARLLGLKATLPPLRERREDLGVIVRALLARSPRPDARLELDAARALFAHDFPLNIRELERALQAAVVVAGAADVGASHLFGDEPALAGRPRALDLRTGGLAAGGRARRGSPPALDAEALAHKAELEELLRVHGGNVSAVARATGKARMQIQRWMRRYGLGR